MDPREAGPDCIPRPAKSWVGRGWEERSERPPRMDSSGQMAVLGVEEAARTVREGVPPSGAGGEGAQEQEGGAWE